MRNVTTDVSGPPTVLQVHWPHSAAGACGTPNQFQTPFYDGTTARHAAINTTCAQLRGGAGINIVLVETLLRDGTFKFSMARLPFRPTGVFCKGGIISLDPLNTYEKIGVQAQVFTIINDEAYYFPDLMRGMIVDGERGADIAMYTGSTTGTSRNNEICSRYTPITWQVRKIIRGPP